MPSANNTSNSSNIPGNINYLVTQSELGSRLIVNLILPNSNSFSIGDVIRYDVPTSGYTQASSDTSANSEVFGVIETIEETLASVVLYGSINYPSEELINVGGVNHGGNDIYFLSADSPGKLVNIAPSTIGNIIKPIYQVAPHSTVTNLSCSGVIMNYVGYYITG